ncbi:MAG: MOSC domain-containing protein [Chloroflexota bacterium]
MCGTVEGIYLAPTKGQPVQSVEEVVGEAGSGLVGDRHYRAPDDPRPPDSKGDTRNVSLVEAEVLESLREEHGLELAGWETRRNILVRGIRLHELIGKRFRLGGMLCEGMEICEPCASMQQKVGRPVMKPLLHRGGLRARIVESGTVRIGDSVAQAEAVPAT